MNGQIVLYMVCYPPICSNGLSDFIMLTGALVENKGHNILGISNMLCPLIY